MVRDAGLKVLLASDAAGEPRTRADVIAEALGPDLTAVVALGPSLRPAGGMLSQEAFGQLAELQPGMAVSEEEVIAHCRAGLAASRYRGTCGS